MNTRNRMAKLSVVLLLCVLTAGPALAAETPQPPAPQGAVEWRPVGVSLAVEAGPSLNLAPWATTAPRITERLAAACNVPTGYLTIAAALADPTCDPIIVAAGTYFENLVVDRPVTIQGAGVAATFVDGGGLNAVFLVNAAVVVNLSGLTIQHGAGWTDQYGNVLGGGICNLGGDVTVSQAAVVDNAADWGAGIWSSAGTLHLTGVTVAGDHAAQGGGGLLNFRGQATISDSTISANTAHEGGGVFNLASHNANATLTLVDTTITGNMAQGGAGGGGVNNGSTEGLTAQVTINGCTITGNTAQGTDYTTGLGGGIINTAVFTATSGISIITVNDSTISGNTALNGGGIANVFLGGSGVQLELNVNRSAIYDNTTASAVGLMVGNGGGVINVNGSATIANSTISGNQANGAGVVAGLGGGIANACFGANDILTLINTTVGDNYALVSAGGVATVNLTGAVQTTFQNTIVARNLAPIGAGCSNLLGTVTSLGHNLEDGDTCGFDHYTDQPNTDPLLGPLADNGGPTLTQALLPGSPAIDTADDAACANPPVNGVDQRGVARPQGAHCDIGAYESEIVCPAEVSLGKEANGASDLATLRQFRDEVMAATPAGQRYVDLYYRHAAEVSWILLKDVGLHARTAQLVKELMPGVRGMLGGYQKQEFVLKAGQVKQAQALLDDIGRQGSPALRAAIAEVQPQVAGSAGLTLRQAWEAAAR